MEPNHIESESFLQRPTRNGAHKYEMSLTVKEH